MPLDAVLHGSGVIQECLILIAMDPREAPQGAFDCLQILLPESPLNVRRLVQVTCLEAFLCLYIPIQMLA